MAVLARVQEPLGGIPEGGRVAPPQAVRQREVLVLRYFADMTEAQVAETLGISIGSVKAYGSRGIAALRVAMEAPA